MHESTKVHKVKKKIGSNSFLVFNFIPFATLEDSWWSRHSRAASGATRTPKVIKRECSATTASSAVCKLNKLLLRRHIIHLNKRTIQAVFSNVFTLSLARLDDANPDKSGSNQRGNAITNKLWFYGNLGKTLNIFALNEPTGSWRVRCRPLRFPVFTLWLETNVDRELMGNNTGICLDI